MGRNLFDAIGDEMGHPEDTTEDYSTPLVTPPDTDPADEDVSEVRTKLQKFISTELLNGGDIEPDDHGVFNFLYGDTHIAIEAYEG